MTCIYLVEICFGHSYGLLGAKPISFPMEQNHCLGKAKGAFQTSPDSYRYLAGQLIELIFGSNKHFEF